MLETPLMPYVAYAFFEPGARQFQIALHGLKNTHGIRLQFIRHTKFEEKDDGQYITFDHVTGVFVIRGQNLPDSLIDSLPIVRDLYQFDPKRHQPVSDNAPLIRAIKVLEYSPGRPRFEIPRHVLYADSD